MKGVYTALIKQDGDMFLAYLPDLDSMTQGNSFFEAIEMARDLLGTYSLAEELPTPVDVETAKAIAIEKADDEDFKFSDGIIAFVDIDTNEYKKKLNTKAVRRNVSLPAWLNEKAEAAGVNFSRVLQDALIERLEIH